MDPVVNQQLADALSGMFVRLLDHIDSRNVGDNNIPFKKPILIGVAGSLTKNSIYHITGSVELTLPTDAAIGDFLKLTKGIGLEPTILAGVDITVLWKNGTMSSFLFNVDSEVILIKTTANQWEMYLASSVSVGGSDNAVVITSPATVNQPGRYLIKGNQPITLVDPNGQVDGLVYEFITEVGQQPTVVTTTDGFLTDSGAATSLLLDTRRTLLCINNNKYEA